MRNPIQAREFAGFPASRRSVVSRTARRVVSSSATAGHGCSFSSMR